MEVEVGDGKDIDRLAMPQGTHTEYRRHRLSDVCI